MNPVNKQKCFASHCYPILIYYNRIFTRFNFKNFKPRKLCQQ